MTQHEQAGVAPQDLAVSKPVQVDAPATPPAVGDRIAYMRESDDARFHLFKSVYAGYEPPPYASLRDEEMDLLKEWFEDMQRRNLRGATGPGLVGVMQAFIAVSGLSRVVQLGHYAGYSTLMLGFTLRRMGATHRLFTADINPRMTKLTQQWVDRAGLSDNVRVYCDDSANPKTRQAAEKYLGGAPEAVLIDSSHQYDHTLAELDLWYDALVPGGLMFLHDVSDFAASFDSTRRGGVRRALDQWLRDKNLECIRLNSLTPGFRTKRSYVDGCGLGLLQKPDIPSTPEQTRFEQQSEALRKHWPEHDAPLWGRVSGTLEAMLVGMRACAEDKPGEYKNRFAPGTRVRLGLAYHCEVPVEDAACELLVLGEGETVAEFRPTRSVSLRPGLNAVEFSLDWPVLPPARRALTVRLCRTARDGEAQVICDCDRALHMHWPKVRADRRIPESVDPAMTLIGVSPLG